jgi:alpha-beta hydrolase superfamily lysophospholipase
MKKTVFGKEVDIDIPNDLFPTTQQIEEHEACLVGCEHGWMESCHRDAKQPNSRFQLHYRQFLPPSGSPKAIVVFLHGIQTHSGKAYQFEPSGETTKTKVNLSVALQADTYVHQHGYAFYAIDFLGHGFSEGKRFYVKDWKENRDDCIQFVELVASHHAPNTPVFVTGESYGGCLAIHVGHAYQQQAIIQQPPPSTTAAATTKTKTTTVTTTDSLKANVDSIMLMAPAIIGDLPPYPVYCFLRYILAPLYPLWVPFFMPNPVSADRIWRDPQVLELHLQDNAHYVIDGSGRPFRLGTAVQLLQALEVCRNVVIPQLHMPYCVLHGTEDHAVPIIGTDFLEQHAPATERAVYRMDGAYHDLMGDWPASKQCMPHLVEWIQKRLEKQQHNK